MYKQSPKIFGCLIIQLISFVVYISYIQNLNHSIIFIYNIAGLVIFGLITKILGKDFYHQHIIKIGNYNFSTLYFWYLLFFVSGKISYLASLSSKLIINLILNPIYEEFANRAIFTCLTNNYRTGAFIIINSIIFTTSHVIDTDLLDNHMLIDYIIFNLFPIFILGLILATISAYFKRLDYAIIIHILVNIFII